MIEEGPYDGIVDIRIAQRALRTSRSRRYGAVASLFVRDCQNQSEALLMNGSIFGWAGYDALLWSVTTVADGE
ncbi:MAG TPA: hypothetical protein VGZ04_12130 [Acidimicrobiales bacterium]|jgi:hypothetical protein|nr:hypothetical protein [Acidimicrobiales bacterium]